MIGSENTAHAAGHFFNIKLRKNGRWCSCWLLVILCLAACKEKRAVNQDIIDDDNKRNNNAWNLHAVDSAVGMLHTGDLVLRHGIDVTSDLLRQINRTDQSYSHCGLVIVEHGYPFVYHSIGGESNPDACLRRDSASFFFSPLNNLGFGVAHYLLGPGEMERMKNEIYDCYRRRVKFDMNFDLGTDDKLYCAEFVYKVMNKAADTPFLKPTRILRYNFVGVDNLYLNPRATLIWQVKFK
jgi:hypothetical protein